ncbi:MAG: MBL fold metallo-hydrolase [Actinomycetota bacterium]
MVARDRGTEDVGVAWLMGDEPIHRSRPTGFDLRPASMPEAAEVAPRVWVSEGLSNTFCLPTDEGRVVVNTGMGFESPVHKRNFDALDDGPVHSILLTQGHVDHVGGVDHLREPGTRVVAQAGNPAHQADDDRIAAYRMDRSSFAFGETVLSGIRRIAEEFGSLPAQAVPTPDVLVDDELTLDIGGRRFQLLHVPGGETVDSLVVWLPEEGVLISGNFFSALFGHIPNLVTLRGDRLRDPLVFLRSTERILALEAEVLLPGHHQPVRGAATVRREIERVRDATRWVHDRTVEGMNDGRTLWQLMDEVELPPDLEVGEGYGKVAWGVRAIWELYAGWFKHESTTELYGSPRADADADVVAVVGAEALLARARELVADDPLRAIHLAEIVAHGAPGTDGTDAVLADAHGRLRDGEENFWLASWLDERIEAHGGGAP